MLGGYAAIGGGKGENAGNIKISGGTIKANTFSTGAAIGGGGGKDLGEKGGAGGNITIEGGVVEANADTGGRSAAIGGGGGAANGAAGGAGGTIKITGGNVTATASNKISNIGAGRDGEKGSIIVNGQSAVVYCKRIFLEEVSATQGLVFSYVDNKGIVYGDVVLDKDFVVDQVKTLNIAQGNSLTINKGVTLTNNGTIINNGQIINNGKYIGSGKLQGNAIKDNNLYLITVNDGVSNNSNAQVGTQVSITANKKQGSVFRGWTATTSDVIFTDKTNESTTFNMPNHNVTITANIVEAAKLHTVTYDGNGNIGGIIPTDTNSYLQNETVNVLDEENIIKNGYIFDGWNTKQNGTGTLYKTGETFIMGASNVTLYAQWREGTRYEAENATINGANKETNVEGASGKSQVGSINNIGSYVEFPNIPAYSKVLVHYASSISGKISVYLDNNKINELTFTLTGGWSGVGKYKNLNFELNSSNGGALKFQYDKGDGALNIDYIEIVKNPAFNSIIEANTENTEKGTVNVTNAEALGENNYKTKDGKEVTLTAVPKEGYNFYGWYDAFDKKVSNRPAWSFKVTEYGSYTAKFVLMPKVALTVSTVGTGNISINGGTQITNKTEQYSLGTVVTLTAIDSENSPFEYWVDNNGRAISTSKTYNLYLGSDTTIKAMFNTKTASTHLVTFKNGITGDIIQKSYAAEGETVTELANPYMYGYTFNGWDKTPEDIKAAIKDIVVNALFKKNEVKYTVTVSGGTINGGAISGQYDIKEFITVTASAAEIGQKFSHWVDSKGNIVCYDATYKFYVTAGIQLTAVYVTEDSKVEQKASIVLNATPNQDTKKIAFLTTRNVPVGCTIISHGVILTNNSETATSADTFILGAADILKATSKDNSLLGTYIITKGNVATGAIWYGRGYLIYKDTNGNVVTVYSSIESGTIN